MSDQFEKIITHHLNKAVENGLPPEVIERTELITDCCIHCLKSDRPLGAVLSNYQPKVHCFFIYVLCKSCGRDYARTSKKWKNGMMVVMERNLLEKYDGKHPIS